MLLNPSWQRQEELYEFGAFDATILTQKEVVLKTRITYNYRSCFKKKILGEESSPQQKFLSAYPVTRITHPSV